MLRIALVLIFAASSVSLARSPLTPDLDVTPRGGQERLWFDAHGRTIKILNGQGRLTFLTRDDHGRIVQAAAARGWFTPKMAEFALTNDMVWSHFFAYGNDGKLVGEFDCSGASTAFSGDDDRRVNERIGTALKDHRHVTAPSGR